MKWLVAIDPSREIVENKKKMIHFIYDEIRRLGPGKVAPANLMQALNDGVRDGRLKTRTDPWYFSQRRCIPWLKEHGYIATDVPYKPRSKQRSWPTYRPLALEFCSRTSCAPAVAESIADLRGNMAALFAEYEGRTIHEGILFLELRKRPSPTGVRTMWEYFKSINTHLLRAGALRWTNPDDPFIDMALKMKLDELGRLKEEA